MVSPPLGGVREYASPRDGGLELAAPPQRIRPHAPRGVPAGLGGGGHIPPPRTWGRGLLQKPPPVLGLTSAQSCAQGRRIMGSSDGDGFTCGCSERATRVLLYCFCWKEAVSSDRLPPPPTAEAKLRAEGSWACWAFLVGSNGRMQHRLAVQRRAGEGHVRWARDAGGKENPGQRPSGL